MHKRSQTELEGERERGKRQSPAKASHFFQYYYRCKDNKSKQMPLRSVIIWSRRIATFAFISISFEKVCCSWEFKSKRTNNHVSSSEQLYNHRSLCPHCDHWCTSGSGTVSTRTFVKHPQSWLVPCPASIRGDRWTEWWPANDRILSGLCSWKRCRCDHLGGRYAPLCSHRSSRSSVAFLSIRSGSIQYYWNFRGNEQFEVLPSVLSGQVVLQCLRQELTATSETSVIQPNTLIVKPSILLGYDELDQVNPNWGVTSLGEEMIRGMPTKVFQSCFYVNDIKATVAATYHVTDPAKFQSYLPRRQGIIVQIQVDIISQSGGRDHYTYHFFRYSPNPNRFEERQALETPAGVFCPNRSPGLPIPSNIPNRVSSNSELYLPNLNGSIISSHRLIDTEFQFTRLDVWYPDPKGSSDWIHYTEIHDFATGLSYKYEPGTRQCSVGNITLGLNDAVSSDSNPNLIQIGNPEHFFLLDDVEYQYTGEKRCRDRVLCHVWIAEKIDANNLREHREWYWASSINGEALAQWIPMKVIFKQYSADALVNDMEISNWETTEIESSPNTSDLLAIFDYRRNPLTLLEVDFALADCYRALGPDRKYLLECETCWLFSASFQVVSTSLPFRLKSTTRESIRFWATWTTYECMFSKRWSLPCSFDRLVFPISWLIKTVTILLSPSHCSMQRPSLDQSNYRWKRKPWTLLSTVSVRPSNPANWSFGLDTAQSKPICSLARDLLMWNVQLKIQTTRVALHRMPDTGWDSPLLV